MQVWRTTLSGTTVSQERENRRHGRLRTEGAASSLGTVLDLSASGMKVFRKGVPPVQEGETFRIEVRTDCEALPVNVIVRRITKVGRRRFEYGLEFIEMTDADRARLTRFARIAASASRAIL